MQLGSRRTNQRVGIIEGNSHGVFLDADLQLGWVTYTARRELHPPATTGQVCGFEQCRRTQRRLAGLRIQRWFGSVFGNFEEAERRPGDPPLFEKWRGCAEPADRGVSGCLQ